MLLLRDFVTSRDLCLHDEFTRYKKRKHQAAKEPPPRILAWSGQRKSSPVATVSFFELFLDTDLWRLLYRQTNLRAEKYKQSKPTSYYAKNFQPVGVPQLKAFLSLRLQMEKSVIKQRYESYWQGVGHSLISCTPGFREVIERGHFIGLGIPALG